MWCREAARRGLRAAAIALLATGAGLLAACGDDDFENNPRPPSPVELTAAIDPQEVSVSPRMVGAGLINLTISNQTDEPTRLTLEGPTSATSSEIPPGGTGSIKAALEEGSYEAAAGTEIDIEPAKLTVGPERPTSQNELLQP